MGNLSRLLGDAFERRLDLLHALYRRDGLAHVERHGVRARFSQGRWVAEKSLPDYGGALRGGLSVYFDAKFIEGAVYSHPKTRTHQTRFLYEMSKMGALTFLLIANDERGWIVWPQAHWQIDKGWTIRFDGKTALTAPYCIDVPAALETSGVYVPDWFRAIETRAPDAFVHYTIRDVQ